MTYSQTDRYVIPDLHRTSSLLLLLIFVQLISTVLWLVQDEELTLEWYALCSLYLQSTLLLLCATLGLVRNFITKLRFILGVSFFILIFISCFLLVEWVRQALIGTASMSTARNALDMSRFMRIGIAALLLSLLCARVFYLLQLLSERSQAEVQSRVDALQARINPHFLFNSLNSISELACTQPERAEDAIQSLAMLFRVSLENKQGQHSLENELVLCQRFVELESWRFEGGLHLEYKVACADTHQWKVPKLILQPLIENAVKYGVANEKERPIRLLVSETKHAISFKLTNYIDTEREQYIGNGMALDNIKDRLFMLYDDRYTFSCRAVDGEYYVLMQLPKEPL